MLSYLKSAAAAVVSNVQQAAAQAAQAAAPPIQVGERCVVVKEQLGEGGFAYVSLVEDIQTGETFAMKRMLCQDRESMDIAEKEITMMRRLKGHPNIITYIASAKRENTQSSHRAIEYFILMELCTGGSLIDLIRRRNGRPLGEIQICDLFTQICQGVAHMHAQNPPVSEGNNGSTHTAPFNWLSREA
jgi:cyclin G-associated kinase